MYSMKPTRSYYEGADEYGDPIMTANEVVVEEGAETWTGLYNADGEEIHRVPEKVRLGFHGVG
jgi:hypothetical protein